MMIGHATAALALLFAQATSAPAPRPCITPDEAGAIAAVAFPEFVDAFSQRCSQHLPATAWLRTNGPGLVQRWRSEGAAQRETAFSAMRKMMPANAQAGRAAAAPPPPEVAMQGLIGGLTGALSIRLNAASCTELGRFVEALAPLPAANVAQLISAVMGFGVSVTPTAPEGAPPICRS